ncbi:MAG: AAA family ATPase [Chitinivibrionales bacterium]|nr:AAA family ATPase [Chitinivibrionales bacterium]
MKIAVSGKGGVGKTTLSALLAKSFADDNLKVIAIDADPDANLAEALGFPPELEITPLVEMRDLIKERVGAEPDQATVYFTMNPRVDDIPDKFSISIDNIKLLVMGTVRRGGSGCACPQNVMVKQLLGHVLFQRDEIVIMDMEAGIEHLGRGTSQFVDLLCAVVEPTSASLKTWIRIRKLAEDLNIKKTAIIANKVSNEQDRQRIQSVTGETPWCEIPFSDSLSDYNKEEIPPEIREQISTLKKKIQRELMHGN